MVTPIQGYRSVGIPIWRADASHASGTHTVVRRTVYQKRFGSENFSCLPPGPFLGINRSPIEGNMNFYDLPKSA